MAESVNLVFASPQRYDSISLIAALLGYSVQIYCDFAGYSEMAIGCSRILGFHLPDNFRMPYSSASITEFWRRWHITLSGWFRDYVFLPLEIATRSSFKPWIRLSLNTTLTMLLCGLWHGAGWNFLFWGGIHGAALATHNAWTTWDPLHAFNNSSTFRRAWGWTSHLLTLMLVLLGWVFFRADSLSTACLYLGRMFSFTHDGTRLISPQVASGVVAVVLVHLLVNKDRDLVRELPERSVPARILGYTALVSLLVCLGATDSAPFIYFQF
jgi:alginate O-acetyltransferase complex protein AlgI